MLDAELKHNVAMPSRLRQNSLTSIGKQDSKFRGRCATCHVTRVLLVAGCVGHNERPARGRKVTIGYVDGDALLPLGLEPIDEKSEVNAASRPITLTVLFDGPKLIIWNQITIVKEPANQSALAVIDAAARQEAKNAFLVTESAGLGVFECEE